MDWFLPTLWWYLATTAASLAVIPLLALLFRHVSDRGATLAHPIGLLLVVWPVWFLAGIGDGIVPFGPVSLWIALAAVAAVSWIVGIRSKSLDRTVLFHYGAAEAAYLLIFSGYLAFRGYVPAIGGPNIIDQEKPMDLMMLASSMKATHMPPADAWLSGEPINYYYLGYTLWGAVGRMIHTTPAITYNLALASIVAMTVVALFGTVANILTQFRSMIAARIGGALAVLLVLLIGNPWAAWTFLRDPSVQWQAWPFDGIMWNATRIIEDAPNAVAISEFPAFSYLFADMHPHVMAIPYAVTSLGTGWMLASLPDRSSVPLRLGRLSLAGLVGVSLYAMNSWDLPTWLGVILLGVLISSAFRTVGENLSAIAITVVAGAVAWSPFILRFDAPVRAPENGFAETLNGVPVIGGVIASVAAYSGDRTSILDYLSIFGYFYPILLVTIVVALASHQDGDGDPLVTRLALISGVIMAAIGLLLPAPLLILVGLPMLAGLVVILRSTTVTLELLAVGLATLSFVLTLLPEFFYLLDVFGNRMNTIFKLYLQVWLLSGVAAALAVIYLWGRARAWRPAQGLIAVATALVLVTGLTYPIVAASQWLQFKNPDGGWQGIDGVGWLEDSDPATANAITWLRKNASNADVLLAAGGCSYVAPVGFPSAASGVPSIVGWTGHERQWHLGDEAITNEIAQRLADVVNLFARPDDELLDRYGVTLLYIGRPETQGVSGVEGSTDCAPGPFPEATSQEFPGGEWTEVFSEDGVRILRRDTGSQG